MQENHALTLFTTLEASFHLKICADRVRELCRQGKISHKRFGRRYMMSATDIQTYIDSFNQKGQQ